MNCWIQCDTKIQICVLTTLKNFGIQTDCMINVWKYLYILVDASE